MIKIKNFLLLFISIGIIAGLFYLKDLLVEKIFDSMKDDQTLIIREGNNYVKNYDFMFVKQEKEYVPNNYQDLVNIFYSMLNQGWLEFTFYCPTTYETCLDDVAKISNDNILLSDINNFVHPYNGYSSIRTVYDDTGVVTIYINRLYSISEIVKLNEEIDKIMDEVLTDDMSLREKIKILHDYIIVNTIYDSERADNGTSDYDSSRMTGALYEHYAICSGYTDLMAVMLEKLGVPNFKVASDTHIWNAVYLDGKWLHLDLTWDDPITALGKDTVIDTFFLVTTDELYVKDNKTDDHKFNKTIYLELAY